MDICPPRWMPHEAMGCKDPCLMLQVQMPRHSEGMRGAASQDVQQCLCVRATNGLAKSAASAANNSGKE